MLSVETTGRKTMVDDWGTIVERRMDSDSLDDAGVMLLVFGMLVFAINVADRRGGN